MLTRDNTSHDSFYYKLNEKKMVNYITPIRNYTTYHAPLVSIASFVMTVDDTS